MIEEYLFQWMEAHRHENHPDYYYWKAKHDELIGERFGEMTAPAPYAQFPEVWYVGWALDRRAYDVVSSLALIYHAPRSNVNRDLVVDAIENMYRYS